MVYAQPLESASSTLKLNLYQNVKNTPELRQKIINGDIKCCLIKPNLICDPFQVVVAANKAVTAEKLKTKSVYSEVLFNLSVSKNISQSLQLFGIEDGESDVLIATLETTETESDVNQVFEIIRGDEVDVSCLSELCNRENIKKVYKIGDVEYKELNMLESIVSRIAAKDVL